MKKAPFLCLSLVGLFLAAQTLRATEALATRQWTMDGLSREALIHIPAQATTKPTPVLFVFHGHGGSADQIARRNAYETLWPEAIVVYPQGLPTPGQLTDPQGERAGWQKTAGDQGDRDLKFFDAILASLRQDYRVDDQRIYVTGHSNGGSFTYLLWAERGDIFAAVAPTSAAAMRLAGEFKPKPAFLLGGESDPLVRFAWQKATFDRVLAVDQCGPGVAEGNCLTRYPSKIGAPVVTYIHPGGHRFPDEAAPLIVRFFQSQAKAR